MPRQLCFVLMPFGRKSNDNGREIDFDAVYADLIRPAIEAAALDPIRADEAQFGGIIHKRMLERLVMCDFAVVDLTLANVFYELGVRHATRPHSTVALYEQDTRLPFDVSLMRPLPYSIGGDGKLEHTDSAIAVLTNVLQEASTPSRADSPVFQLVDGLPVTEIDRAKTDTFRELARYSEQRKAELAEARQAGVQAIKSIEDSLGEIEGEEMGVVVDLFLSYRAVKAWDFMIALVDRMAEPLRRSVLVQEQYALALNRAGKGDRAESVLLQLIKRRGTSSETNGILGRVYKDRWSQAVDDGEPLLAEGLLKNAVDAYVAGFEADWRDAYPGVNAVTLMEMSDPPDDRQSDLIPVVAYAVQRRIAAGSPDYWDYATLLELAVLGGNRRTADKALGQTLAQVRESWEPETTARNLRLIQEKRAARGEDVGWIESIVAELERAEPA